MKITIDTKEDSPEDIKRVITLLSHLTSEPLKANAPANIFDSPSADVQPQADTASLMNMFNQPQQATAASPAASPETRKTPGVIEFY